jgi:Xaa-Pro dipeptidase
MTLGAMATDVENRIDFEALRKYRLGRAREQMEKHDLGGLLCFDLDNIRYITNTNLAEWARGKYMRWCLLPREGEPVLFEMGTAAVAKREFCPWLEPQNIRVATPWFRGGYQQEVNLDLSKAAMREIKAILQENGVEKMAVGLDESEGYITHALESVGLEVRRGYDAMFEARIIKSPEELQLIELSAAMVDAVFAEIFDFIRPGVRETEIVAKLHSSLIRNGVDRISGIVCVSGPRSNPHPHDFSDRMIRPGDPVFIDIASHFLGYATCYYRTFAVTRAAQKHKEVYKRAMDWLQASIDVMRPGITTADVAHQWPSAKELGYEDERQAFALAIGHGVGLSHHEKPWITRAYSLDHPVPIEQGMHIALETFYGEGEYGARIEQQIIVTPDGHNVITKWPCEELLVCDPI